MVDATRVPGHPVPRAAEQYPHTTGQQRRGLGPGVPVANRGALDAMRVGLRLGTDVGLAIHG